MSPAPANRRGWTLLETMSGIFVSGAVLSVCVPLFHASQRQADTALLRSRMQAEAREITAAFTRDVREATAVEMDADGRWARLTLTRPDSSASRVGVEYRTTSDGLERRQSGSGTAPERFVYGAPLREAEFRRVGAEARLRIRLAAESGGRVQRLDLSCADVPRSMR